MEHLRGFFKATRGLRQGDPLSSFLFSLVTDGRSTIIRRVEDARLMEGFIIGDDKVMVFHLQFANDMILFLKVDVENIRRVEMCMKIFQIISSLKVNSFKTCMVGIEVEESSLNSYAKIMGCSVGRWLIKYLGMPLGGNPKVMAFWDPVVEKVFKKLTCWKRSYIFFGGHITLIKGALSYIPVYYMSMYKIPTKVTYVIERYQWEFLWDGRCQKKVHLVKWEVVVKSKEKRGLGLDRIKERNLTLLGKWLWRFMTDQGSCGIPSFLANTSMTIMGENAIGTFLDPSPFVGSTLPK